MKEVKIGLLGFGNVGTGVYKILRNNNDVILHREGFRLKIEKILVRNIAKKRMTEVESSLFTDQASDILDNPEIEVIAELMGGVEPALQYITAALKKGKAVVTANKEVMAKYWTELEEIARQNHAGLYYEASVGGGIPVIKVMGESLQANRVTGMMGIINGTTNYILTKMSEEGRSFESVLAEAQRLGYAESDPTADIEGFDAMYKLSILSSLAFHARVPLDRIYREGIAAVTAEDIAYGKELGFALKLLAIAKKRGQVVEARVHPTFIPLNHPLAAVRESNNAIFIQGDAVGDLMLYGRGAGDMPTGSAIISDIITACHRRDQHCLPIRYDEDGNIHGISFNEDWHTEFFIRLTVKDRPGVLAKISGVLGKHGVSIASVIQKDHNGESVPLIFVIHLAGEMAMRTAIQEVSEIDDVIQVENIIRVER